MTHELANPSLNRTPAGGLSPARRSPVVALGHSPFRQMNNGEQLVASIREALADVAYRHWAPITRQRATRKVRLSGLARPTCCLPRSRYDRPSGFLLIPLQVAASRPVKAKTDLRSDVFVMAANRKSKQPNVSTIAQTKATIKSKSWEGQRFPHLAMTY
jgi:hypothetical protein